MTADVQRELADRIPAWVGLTHDEPDQLAAALLPTVQALIADAEKRAAARALRDAADQLDDGGDEAIEVALGGAAYVHRVLCDRAAALDPQP